jgi:uncharacterized protein YdaU (DUF1376 family)
MPTPKRPPAFQFYPDAWFGSIAVELMPPEVEGTYLRLLARQWLAVNLPADPEQLCRLTKLTPAQWKKAWPLLEPHFPLIEGGAFRQNETLHALHEERQEFVAKQQENGKKGGRPKKTQAFSLGSAWVNPDESSVSGSGSGSGSNNSVIPEECGIPSPAPAIVKTWVAPHGHAALDALFAVVSEPTVWVATLKGWRAGLGLNHNRPASPVRLAAAVQEFVAMGKHREPNGPSLRYLRGFVENAKDAPATPSTRRTDAEHKAEELHDLRHANATRQRLGLEPKPLPSWAAQIDAMFPDGRTHPAGVAA